MKGGRTPFFFSGQWIPPSLSVSFSPLSILEHPRLPKTFAHTSCSLQTQVDVRGRGKAADAGQSHALERLAGHPTVDAVSPGHLEPPPRPVDVPRRPQHATALAPSFPPLSCPCRACPEPPEPANAYASSWLHPELAPLPLSLPGALIHPH